MLRPLQLLISLILVTTSWELQAHSRGESYSVWQIEGNTVELTYTVKLKDINKLANYFQAGKPGWPDRVSRYIEEKVQISADGMPCTDLKNFSRSQRNDLLQLTKSFTCANTDSITITNHSLFDLDARHMHIARVTLGDQSMLNKASRMDEKVMLYRDREWQLFQTENNSNLSGSTFQTYLILGAEHIVTGWDHLAFLLAILLLILVRNGSLKTLLVMISGFTLGHSISLVLTMLELLKPNGLVVESMIAFSIALLAIEVLGFKQQQLRSFALLTTLTLIAYTLLFGFPFSIPLSSSIAPLPTSAIPSLTLVGLCIFVFCYLNISNNSQSHLPQILITLLFGFVHGFGFAGSLQEIGLPQEKLFIALLSFNVGVELGQIAIVAAALAAFHWARKNVQSIRWELGFELACAALVGIGLFWFVERSIY